MQINIRARGFSLTSSLRSHAERRLRFALTRCCDRIERVVMLLTEFNQLSDRLSKRCHLQVVMAGQADVVVETTEADFYTAINRATDRAGRNLMLRLHGNTASDTRPHWTHRSHST